MSKFNKKGGKGLPSISTASLPDIVFMLLFFFMVTTVMRETTLKVEVTQEGTQFKLDENGVMTVLLNDKEVEVNSAVKI